MEYRKLGATDIEVSALCLGTMTWGEQNTESDAHAQLDLAVTHGVNFIDTAEMYPVPPRAETQGRTEKYLGTWLERQPRDKLIIATKAAGCARMPHNPRHVRGGRYSFNRTNLEEAVNDSLARLRTDYIDLYQLHWPDRTVNIFGQREYAHADNEDTVPIDETLEALDGLIRAGKIRHVGVSNETPWGVMRFLHEAETRGLPRIVSIQHPYSLVNRGYETGLSEISIRENCGLLAYSPLAFGVLSGKYLDGARPAGARITLFERFQRYNGANTVAATAEYVKLAREHGLDPAQMALAFVTSRRFVTSNILGATTVEQLKSNLDSFELTLSPEVLSGIEAVQRKYPNPAC